MIKPEYKNIPDTEFVPLTENEVGEYFAGLYEINKKGEVRNVKTKRTLKIVNSNSYPRLVLSLKKTYKSCYIHNLLARTFILNDNPKEKIYVDHINRNVNDYSLENLRWVTASENNKNRKISMNNYFYIKRKEKNGPIIDKVPVSSIESKVRNNINSSIKKDCRYKGYYWERINIDVENKLKELGITEKDLKFVENKKYPGVEFSKEGILKTNRGLTLGSLRQNYYSLTISNGGKYQVHRFLFWF